ncbi:CDP-alcohol phosphatidyltransferase-domain-containing protein [Syncephalis plumigaleata]|nr:CDP-alcohol phosphatidyltransferase-domain-containing protein [Syncephalis plumigaleata]
MVTCRSLWLLRCSSYKPYNIWSCTRQHSITTTTTTLSKNPYTTTTRYATILTTRQPSTHQHRSVSIRTRALLSLSIRAFSQSIPLKSTQNDELPSNPPPLKRHKFQFKQDVLTLPNLLTMTRIAATPYLGHLILSEQYSTGLAVFALISITDLLDGYIARRWHMTSFIGSLLDPLADKFMMTVMTVTLSMQHLVPVPLAMLIIGRDVGLILSAFYYRYHTLPPPLTLARFFDVSVASTSVHPSMISKVNTALQVALMAISLMYPVMGLEVNAPLIALQWAVAATTIGSGVGYMFANNIVKSI